MHPDQQRLQNYRQQQLQLQQQSEHAERMAREQALFAEKMAEFDAHVEQQNQRLAEPQELVTLQQKDLEQARAQSESDIRTAEARIQEAAEAAIAAANQSSQQPNLRDSGEAIDVYGLAQQNTSEPHQQSDQRSNQSEYSGSNSYPEFLPEEDTSGQPPPPLGPADDDIEDDPQSFGASEHIEHDGYPGETNPESGSESESSDDASFPSDIDDYEDRDFVEDAGGEGSESVGDDHTGAHGTQHGTENPDMAYYQNRVDTFIGGFDGEEGGDNAADSSPLSSRHLTGILTENDASTAHNNHDNSGHDGQAQHQQAHAHAQQAQPQVQAQAQHQQAQAQVQAQAQHQQAQAHPRAQQAHAHMQAQAQQQQAQMRQHPPLPSHHERDLLTHSKRDLLPLHRPRSPGGAPGDAYQYGPGPGPGPVNANNGNSPQPNSTPTSTALIRQRQIVVDASFSLYTGASSIVLDVQAADENKNRTAQNVINELLQRYTRANRMFSQLLASGQASSSMFERIDERLSDIGSILSYLSSHGCDNCSQEDLQALTDSVVQPSLAVPPPPHSPDDTISRAGSVDSVDARSEPQPHGSSSTDDVLKTKILKDMGFKSESMGKIADSLAKHTLKHNKGVCSVRKQLPQDFMVEFGEYVATQSKIAGSFTMVTRTFEASWREHSASTASDNPYYSDDVFGGMSGRFDQHQKDGNEHPEPPYPQMSDQEMKGSWFVKKRESKALPEFADIKVYKWRFDYIHRKVAATLLLLLTKMLSKLKQYKGPESDRAAVSAAITALKAIVDTNNIPVHLHHRINMTPSHIRSGCEIIGSVALTYLKELFHRSKSHAATQMFAARMMNLTCKRDESVTSMISLYNSDFQEQKLFQTKCYDHLQLESTDVFASESFNAEIMMHKLEAVATSHENAHVDRDELLTISERLDNEHNTTLTLEDGSVREMSLMEKMITEKWSRAAAKNASLPLGAAAYLANLPGEFTPNTPEKISHAVQTSERSGAFKGKTVAPDSSNRTSISVARLATLSSLPDSGHQAVAYMGAGTRRTPPTTRRDKSGGGSGGGSNNTPKPLGSDAYKEMAARVSGHGPDAMTQQLEFMKKSKERVIKMPYSDSLKKVKARLPKLVGKKDGSSEYYHINKDEWSSASKSDFFASLKKKADADMYHHALRVVKCSPELTKRFPTARSQWEPKRSRRSTANLAQGSTHPPENDDTYDIDGSDEEGDGDGGP